MSLLDSSFLHIKGVLNEADLSFLRKSCKHQLNTFEIPCYSVIHNLTDPTYLKIHNLVQSTVQEKINYLNDFYFYTDSSFAASWHMDTELFSFENAINAWILLSPVQVSSPLQIINSINENEKNFYHTVEINENRYEFANLCTGDLAILSQEELEAKKTISPDIKVGDILLFNPKKFHKTYTTESKHCIVFKFIYGAPKQWLSKMQVSELLWPEVATFNELVEAKGNWDEVLQELRSALNDGEKRKNLSSGFFPERFAFYKTAAESL